VLKLPTALVKVFDTKVINASLSQKRWSRESSSHMWNETEI